MSDYTLVLTVIVTGVTVLAGIYVASRFAARRREARLMAPKAE